MTSTENRKIRVVFIRLMFNDERIALVEKFMTLRKNHRRRIIRANRNLERPDHDYAVYEGFLESKDKLRAVGIRLAEQPIVVPQGDTDFQTYLIDEAPTPPTCN